MNDARLTPDDPKLTAYALGELEGEDLVAVEEALRRDPALRATVEEIRTTAAQLEAALAAEPDVESVVAAAAASPMHAVPVVDEYRQPKKGALGRLFQFPQVYFVVGGLAAACFALVVTLNNPSPPLGPVIVHAPRPAADDPASVPFTIVGEKDGQETRMTVRVSVVRDQSALAPTFGDGGMANKKAGADSHTVAQSAPPTDETKPAEGKVAQNTLVPAPPAPVENVVSSLAANYAGASEAQAAATKAPLTSATSVPEAVKAATTETTGASVAGMLPVVPPAAQVENSNTVNVVVAGEPAATAAHAPQTTTTPAPVVTPPRLVATYAANAPAPKATPDEESVALSAFSVATERSRLEKLGVPGQRVASTRKLLPPRGARFARTAAGREVTRDNDFIAVDELSARTSFPADVDLGSYGHVRAALTAGRLPTRDEVKIEELVNAFPYLSYAPPSLRDDKPFAAALEVAEAPWAPTHRLVRIGLKGRDRPGSDQLLTIAKEVKIEVTFNPAQVSSYRLIGFENARLNPDDYDNFEGPDISAGHVITALYEVVPIGAEERRTPDRPVADSYLYQSNVVVSSRLETASTSKPLTNELLKVTVGYRKPTGLLTFSTHTDFPLNDSGKRFADASADFKFAAAVAEFGMILRSSPHKGTGTMRDVVAWAGEGAASNADDPRGYRGEFIALARKAERLMVR